MQSLVIAPPNRAGLVPGDEIHHEGDGRAIVFHAGKLSGPAFHALQTAFKLLDFSADPDRSCPILEHRADIVRLQSIVRRVMREGFPMEMIQAGFSANLDSAIARGG